MAGHRQSGLCGVAGDAEAFDVEPHDGRGAGGLRFSDCLCDQRRERARALEDGLEYQRRVLVDVDHDAGEHTAGLEREWQPIQASSTTAVIIATGALGRSPVHLLTLAYRSAPASMIAPVRVHGVARGRVGNRLARVGYAARVRACTSAGAIVVLSGLLRLIWRESRHQVEPAPTATAVASGT